MIDDTFLEKLRKIKEIDKVVDISRSTIQLEILLYLGVREKASIDDLVAGLSYRRKAITDALRKLIKKNLVVKDQSSEEFELSNTGRKYFNELLRILGYKNTMKGIHEIKKSMNPTSRLKNMINEISTAYYLHETLICLGSSPKHEASIETLSSIVNLSPQRLRSYLDLFANKSNPELRLLKKIYRNTLFTNILSLLGVKRSKVKVYYGLTKQGLGILRKLPTYIKLKRNVFLRILFKLTRSCHPKEAHRKMLLLLCGGTILAYALTILRPWGVWIAAIWLYAFIVLTALTILATE